jgi:YYY domain-containing protein
LFVIGFYLTGEFFNGHGHNSVVRLVRLKLRYWRDQARLKTLISHLTLLQPAHQLAMDVSSVALVISILVLLIKPVIGLALFLTLLSALLLLGGRPNPIRQFLLCMIGLGLILTAMVEVVVLKGDISRMNTVFKFYLQVWVLWGIASAVVLPQIATWLRGSSAEEKPSLPNMQGRSRRAMAAYKRNHGTQRSTGSLLWWSIFALLLAACFLYPLTATPVRMKDRFPDSKSTTLDGTAYMQTSTYYDDNRPVALEQDRQAMEWLRQNVRGIPTIAEASTPLYRWGSRVSIYTGFPSVIGWDWHQKQQRSILPGGIVDSRIQDENAIFTSTDPAQIRRLLDRYGVEYIYVGPLERMYYAGDGINKFDQPSDLWSPVYDKDQVKIFRVRRS